MATATVSPCLAEDLASYPGRCELITGAIVRKAPSCYEHGRVAARLIRLLGNFADAQRLGDVIGSTTGFLLDRNPDTVRVPDVAFVVASRDVRVDAHTPFVITAPDLVVEMVAPSASWSDVSAKMRWWLRHGVAQIWLIAPEQRTLTIATATSQRTLHHHENLDGGLLLPGFTVPVADLFA